MKSSSPNSVIVNRVYRDCPIRIRKYEFLGNLIELSFREFDVILGLDWLSRHQVVVDCRMKIVTLRTSIGEEVTFIDERSDSCHGRVIEINNICFLCSSYCRSQATAV